MNILISIISIIVGAAGILVTIVLYKSGTKQKTEANNLPQDKADYIIRLPTSTIDTDKYHRIYRVFISSPTGLEDEQKILKDELGIYSRTDANYRGIDFKYVHWTEIPPVYSRPQDEINGRLHSCEGYVLILWDRFGTPTKNEGKIIYESGSEEEFYEAIKCKNDAKFPMNEIIVLFKKIDEAKLKNPDEQCEKVRNFRDKISKLNTIFYQEFDSLDRFKELIRAVLSKVVRRLEEEINGKIIKNNWDVIATGSPNEDIKYKVIREK